MPSTKLGPGGVVFGKLPLELVGLIEGIAHLEGQEPGSVITVMLVEGSSSQWTNSQGRFYFRQVPAGTYSLSIYYPGHATLVVNDVRVEPGQHVTLPTQTLRPEVPLYGQLLVNGGAKAVSSRTVTVSFEGFEGATHYKLFGPNGPFDKPWTPMTASASWTFASDGPQSVSASFLHENGRESLPKSASVIVDTQPPLEARLLVNGGRRRVSSREVVLSLSAVDTHSAVSEMKVGNDPLLANAQWEPFSNTRAWTLSDDSPTHVYATFRDAQGNELPAPVSTTVTVSPETQVSGTLALDTRWSEEASPYVVTEDLVVPVGGRLTIDPGTEVLFRENTRLLVQGQLVARGTVAAPILFGAEAPVALPGSWRGLTFADSSIDAVLDASDQYVSGSVLEHVEVRHATTALTLQSSSPLVSDSTFHHNGNGTDALLLDQSRALVRNNRIEQNTTRHGLSVYACDARLVGNVVADNNIGLRLHGNVQNQCAFGEGPAHIEDNHFLRNSHSAIHVQGGDSVIRHNDLLENFRDAITVGGADVGTALSVTGGTVVVELNRFKDNRGPPRASSSALSFASGSVRVRNNTLMNATTYDLRLVPPATGLTLEATGNDWSTSIRESIEARVWDGKDDPRLPRIDFMPLLNAPPTGVGAR
ncbi:right-handed parallel beta-helix repeat-containing protein [Myxococcus sp. K15C18031901]|uniref:right-handed parallel beta-helix repeat-containing protein n=1 Tax=Myxococcus dinghuensis TaxID=2906761 RepID=UPI0020A7DA71|nr:right-handed parallel beta-helix repeat-containing protein [Myxococcus dinghuensis]MCP3105489.1 right-handed parallel beta-helix repeat-containing protein [Myxococcus dinghuensis]